MRSRRRILSSAILLAGLFVLVPPVSAVNRGEMHIGPLQTVSQNFPKIEASKPSAPVTPFYSVRPAGCKAENGSYCDAVKFFFDVPAGYRKVHSVTFSLTWDPGVTGNDLQLWVWPEDEDPVSGAPFTGCDSVAANESRSKGSATAGPPPKSCTLGGPTDPISATVVNTKGVNTGYTLTMQWTEQDLNVDRFLKTPTTSGPTKQNKPAEPASATETTDSTLEESASVSSTRTRIAPLIPGADGEPRLVSLPPVDGGVEAARAAHSRRTDGFDPVVAGVTGVLLASGAAAGFVAIRRRRATDLI